MLTAISFPSLGISIDPSPVAFSVMGKDIYWYGLIIAVGFLMAYFYMNARAKHFGLTQDHVLDILLWAVPIGIIGARTYYCVFNWELYRNDPISCLYIWNGGLAIYGGVIGGILGLSIYSKLQKLPVWTVLDLASFGVLIGQIFGRWGNFFNQEAFGGNTELPWGMTGDIIQSGVKDLKIEGRARGAEYVKRVVESYDRALRLMESGEYNPTTVAELKVRLQEVFNRGFWEGYYAGRPVAEHSEHYGSAATRRKVYVGKVVNFYKKISVAEVLVEAAPLEVAEEIFFLGQTTGVVEQKCEELHGPDGEITRRVEQGQLCAIRTDTLIRRGDQLYKFVPTEE